jgi:hypothetical protein
MNNPRIGQLANQLLDLEDAGKQLTPRYSALLAEYEALKAAPENWADVRASKRTPAQAALAAEWEKQNS